MESNKKMNSQIFKYIRMVMIFCCFIIFFLYSSFVYSSNEVNQSQIRLINNEILIEYSDNHSFFEKPISDQYFDEEQIWEDDFMRRFRQDETNGYNMFFIETNSNRKHFTLRQLCSIESAAKNNPKASIQIYSMSAKIDPIYSKKYSNIQLNKLTIDDFLKDTIIENWYKKNKHLILGSEFSIVHISDILRITALWKYGGYYADLDTITVRSVESLLKYPGVGYIDEDGDSLNNAIMSFPKNHPFLEAAFKELMSSYNPNIWGHNGPLLIIRTMESYCQTKDIYKALMFNKYRLESYKFNFTTRENCQVNIFPNNFFNPINWKNVKVLFEENQSIQISKLIDAYTLHFFSAKSKQLNIGRNSVYEYLAKSNCPFTYEILVKYQFNYHQKMN